MLVCPVCRYACEAGMSVCPDCGARLQEKSVGSSQPASDEQGRASELESEDEPLVSVFRAPTQFKLLEVQSALEQEGIAAYLRSFAVSWYDDVYVDPSGAWGELLVAEHDAPHAATIIEVITTGQIVASEGQDP